MRKVRQGIVQPTFPDVLFTITVVDRCDPHNEKLIQESLAGQGWEQTVDDEGWHYECTEARAYARAIIKKKELWNGWAGEWSIAWHDIEKAAEERDK